MATQEKSHALIPIKAICILYDWVFTELKVNCINAKIIPQNKKAINFNTGLGFKIDRVQDNVIYASLDRNDFYEKYFRFNKRLG